MAFLNVLKAMEGTALKNIVKTIACKYAMNSSACKYAMNSSTYKYVIKSMGCVVYRIETLD